MKLWLISQNKNNGYDTYSEAIVAAETEEAARSIHPDGYSTDQWGTYYGSWAPSPEYVSATLVGDAVPGTLAGVVVASFHAG